MLWPSSDGIFPIIYPFPLYIIFNKQEQINDQAVGYFIFNWKYK